VVSLRGLTGSKPKPQALTGRETVLTRAAAWLRDNL
jgi:hypothetical protein